MPAVQEQQSSPILVLAIISFAVFMASLDSSIVNISLPTIATYFDIDISMVSWVVLAYSFMLAGLLLVFGKLGDLYGFRRIFIIGFAIFTLGSLLCGLSSSINHLIAFRALQGIGASALDAIAPAMLVIYLPAEKRGWAIGILATVVSFGIAAGPILGGFITEYSGWHWIFFINVPVGILAVLLAYRYFPVDTTVMRSEPFDTTGSVLILLALISLLFPLNQGLDFGWTSPVILGSFFLSIIFWTLFFIHEHRCSRPLVDMNLFTSRSYMMGNIAGALLMLAYTGTEFLLPFYFENVQGWSTEIAGLLLAVPAIALMIVSPFSGSLSDRIGARMLTTISALFTGATLYLLSLLDPATGPVFIIGVLVLLGAAIGFFFPPNMSMILGSGRNGGEGVTSGVMMMIRNIGAVFGVAVFGTVTVQVVSGMMVRQQVVDASPALLTTGFSTAFVAGVVFCILGAVFSLAATDNRVKAGPVAEKP